MTWTEKAAAKFAVKSAAEQEATAEESKKYLEDDLPSRQILLSQ